MIPCFNLGSYLDEAVESVLAQAVDDVEIIVVDDGSTDPQTVRLLSAYQRPRTRVLRLEHAGLARARNAGISAATGAYLCALDADDRLEPRFLDKAIRVLEEEPEVAFVSCWLRAFGAEDWEWKPERCDLPALLAEDTVLTAALVRRDAVLAVGGYDTAMPAQGDEDWDLWLRLVEQGYRGRILPEVLFNYRRRHGSMSTACWHGPDHLPLTKYRVEKHRASYRAHLVDVLLRQDDETAALLRRNDELERYLGTDLEPMVAEQREELAALRIRLAESAPPGPEQAIQLERALRDAVADRAALRASMSWRVTAPLRAIYGWWLRRRLPE